MVLRLRDMAHAHQVIQQYESALDQTRAALRESHLILLRAAKLSQSLQREDTSPSVHELRHWLPELSFQLLKTSSRLELSKLKT
jgi:hypothetical protein